MQKIIVSIFLVLPFLAGAQTVATTNTLGATGVVGIQSTTSATYSLSVGGSIKQFGTGYNTARSPVLLLGNTTAGTGRTYGINSYDNGLFSIFDANAGSAARFVIDGTGKVGINTTAPQSLLDVNGTGKFSSTLTIQVPDIDPNAVVNSYTHTPSFPALRLGTLDVAVSSINKPMISLGRHLGPGLMLYDNFNTTADCSGIGIIPGSMQFYTGSTAFFTWNTRGYQSTLGNFEQMRLANNGNLMLGTTTDNGAKMQVNGGIWSTAFTLPTGAAAGKVLTSDANGVATWQPATGGGAGSWTLAGNNLSNANTGFIVIGGTTSPDASDVNLKLAVKGNIYAQKLKVTQTGWADYVFAPSYKLRSLQEVKNYIHKNQRLPELPAASEVSSKGIDVGDNQVLLLKKIEELTLYVIKQHEDIRQIIITNARLKLENRQIKKLLERKVQK